MFYQIKVIPMIKNYDHSVKINYKSNQPDHPYKILIYGGSGSGKTNVLLNLIKHQRTDIDKNYVYFKDPLLINGIEKVRIEILKSLSLIIRKQLLMFTKIQKIII